MILSDLSVLALRKDFLTSMSCPPRRRNLDCCVCGWARRGRHARFARKSSRGSIQQSIRVFHPAIG
jgi:hypothetical protein